MKCSLFYLCKGQLSSVKRKSHPKMGKSAHSSQELVSHKQFSPISLIGVTHGWGRMGDNRTLESAKQSLRMGNGCGSQSWDTKQCGYY